MDKMREKHVAEIERLKTAIEKTDSEYLKRDYDRYKGGCVMWLMTELKT